MTTYFMALDGYNWNKINSPYKELLSCVGCLAKPPDLDYASQPVEENRLSFYLICLEEINRNHNKCISMNKCYPMHCIAGQNNGDFVANKRLTYLLVSMGQCIET